MESARSLVKRRTAPQRGFTLIEMGVVMFIITVITLITLLGHSNFDRSMLLTDAAYSIALGAREMQTFGLSSRTTDIGGGTYAANIAYGIHVNSSAPNSYLLFADTQRYTTNSGCPSGSVSTSPDYKLGNCMYETSPPATNADGIVQTYSFSRGFKISSFCGKTSSNTYCSTDSTSPLTALDVVYMRPNTDAVMTGRRSGVSTPVTLTSAAIYITTNDNAATRGICFTQVGQISVATSTCP